MSSQSSLLLKRQLIGQGPKHLTIHGPRTIELTKNPVEGFSAGLVDDDNIFEWEIVIMGLNDTLYEGGFYRAIMTFPVDYPLMPPKLKFTSDMYHPNGEDKYGYEQANERWTPVHTVETILVSVISMLSSPNDESPANIDAAKEWRENYPAYKKKVQRLARRSADEC